LSVIKNGPEGRRNLIDELLKSFSLENVEIINNFKKSLKSRNKILRDYKKEQISFGEAINILNSLDELYLNYVGPHKHDIQFLFNGSDSRYYCSQGQQRAFILAFKMAQIVYHYGIFKKYPILLLDDVMSELDETKRHNLLNFLKGINAQIFITTTEFDLQNQIDHSSLSVYKIVEGKIFDNNSTGVSL